MLRNPSQLDKLLLTISKMAEDSPKDRGNLFENFSQDLDLENEESDYCEMSDPKDPQYEPGRSDVDSDIDLDLVDNDRPRPTYRSKGFHKTPKTSIYDIVFRFLLFHYSGVQFCFHVTVIVIWSKLET